MKFYFLFFCVFFSIQSISQTNQIRKFKIIDSLTSQPIMEGKFYITARFDTLVVASINEGVFLVKCGEYLMQHPLLTITSKGYDTLIINIDTFFCLLDSIHLIKLMPIAKVLQTVEVKTPLIKQDIDKITYNVSSDIESKSLNLLELMPKLPFISLSADDNPLLKGKSNFIVLLNGRRTNIFSARNLREALKAIPASTISKIEIITDPPPRYENEGFIGAINIITLRKLGNGYNGSAHLSAGTFISGSNGSFNVRKNRLGVIFEGGVNLEQTPYNSSYSETFGTNFKIIQQGENKINNFSRNGNLLLSYEIDTLNLLTFDLGSASGKLKNLVNDSATANYGSLPSTYLFNLNQQDIEKGLNLNINYQKNFKKAKDRLFTLSYLLNKNKGTNQISNLLAHSQNYNGNNYIQSSKNGQSDNAIQLDYVHPIKNIKIETGAKYIYRDIFNDFSTTVIRPVTGISFLDTLNTDNLKYNLSILGFYNFYLLKFQSFSLRAGFRFESTILSGNYKTGNYKIKQQYNNLLPSLKFQYKTKNSGVYSINFKQQIQRPGVGLLNPLIVKSAPGFNNTGNPNLKPVLINYINLEFSKFKKASTTLGVSYTFSKNTIQSVSTTSNDTLVLTTFENIGQYKRFGIENSTEVPITSKIDFSIDGSLYYVIVNGKDGIEHLSNKGIEGFIYSYLTYRIMKFRLTTNFGFYGPTVNIQTKSNSYFYSSVSGSMQILKNKGTISLRIANPFQKYRSIITRTNTDELTQFSEQKNLFRGFYISFNFRFGKLDKEVKRNKRSLQIDDAASETGKPK